LDLGQLLNAKRPMERSQNRSIGRPSSASNTQNEVVRLVVTADLLWTRL
jgi:hypothetical protein